MVAELLGCEVAEGTTRPSNRATQEPSNSELYNRRTDEGLLPTRRARRIPRLDARRIRFFRRGLSARRSGGAFGVPKRHIVNTLTATLLSARWALRSSDFWPIASAGGFRSWRTSSISR